MLIAVLMANSAEWTNYLSEAEYDSVKKGIEELQTIINNTNNA